VQAPVRRGKRAPLWKKKTIESITDPKPQNGAGKRENKTEKKKKEVTDQKVVITSSWGGARMVQLVKGGCGRMTIPGYGASKKGPPHKPQKQRL